VHVDKKVTLNSPTAHSPIRWWKFSSRHNDDSNILYICLLKRRTMTEFKVQLEDKLVQTIGYNTIEKYLSDYINQIILKISAQDALNDLKSINLDNDSKWKIAREQAWKEQGYKYHKSLTS
jgi:hypothetical protein